MNGKGGTGKTTVSALFVSRLIESNSGSILAIDADPNSCFAEALGVRDAASIVGICEDISKEMGSIPAGMTKDRFIEMRVQEALTEEKGFDLLVMGRPEGPGCYCYVNNLLRNVISGLVSGYDYVVIDNAAGMEHISRRTMRDMSKLVLVSDYSIPGVRSAGRIHTLAREMKMNISGAYLVMNKVSGKLSAIKNEIDKTGLMLLGGLPYEDDLVEWNISNKPIFEFKNSVIGERIGSIMDKLLTKENTRCL